MSKIIKKETLNYIKEIYKSEKFLNNPTGYFYDLQLIENNIRRLEENMPVQVKLYYAMKANPNKYVMEFIKKINYVKGIEIASEGELEKANQLYSAKDIIFTGPGKTEWELEQAIIKGIRFINVESIAEAVRISNIAKRLKKDRIDILLRVNLDYSLISEAENMSGFSTKMGIDESEYIESYKFISNLDCICVKGIHAFAASGILDYHTLIDVDRYILELVDKIQKDVGEMSVIDLGGGLGIDYSNNNKIFNVEDYGKSLAELIKQYRFENKEFIMELGTYIVGNAGFYTAKIIDIKKIKGKKHIIIAGGINHMGLPLEMRRKHPADVISMNIPPLYSDQPSVNKEIADISGPLCLVSDKLSWDEYIVNAEIGDIIVFRQAGAYCYVEGMHNFLMHAYPEELIIEQ